MKTTPTINNQIASATAAAGLSLEGGGLAHVPEKSGVGGVNFKQPSAKALAFWADKAAKRKAGGHCMRCARPWKGATKQCPACLAYQAKYRGRLQENHGKLTAGMIVAMVKQCRKEVTKLREIIKQMQRAKSRDYQRAYLHRRTVRKYADAYPTITTQELATMNHAYDED